MEQSATKNAKHEEAMRFQRWTDELKHLMGEYCLTPDDFPRADYYDLFASGLVPHQALVSLLDEHTEVQPGVGDGGILDFDGDDDPGEMVEWDYFEHGGASEWNDDYGD